MAIGRAPDARSNYYAVVRLDSFKNFTPRPENVTVPMVVESLAGAEHEVRHLNATAPTGTVYFVQRTHITREKGVPLAFKAMEVVRPIARILDPRSRKARADRKGKKGKKKRR